MKGTDVTPEQIAQAEQLYRRAVKNRADEDPITLRRGDLLRMMAWYAAIRVDSISPGASRTCGELVVKESAK